MQYEFSQLPVMQGDREVKGVVTWKSIGLRKALGSKCERVGDCPAPPRIVDANRTLFEPIPIIIEHGYVLVRQRDRRIRGIVTASDLSLQFQILSEPFLLLREIELHVRQLIRGKITAEDFLLLENQPRVDRPPQDLADLTFARVRRTVVDQSRRPRFTSPSIKASSTSSTAAVCAPSASKLLKTLPLRDMRRHRPCSM